jgi:hypothetical protein
MKSPDEMSVAELLEADREIGSELDSMPKIKLVAGGLWVTTWVDDTKALGLTTRRREIRAELKRRFELSRHSNCPTTDAELDQISDLLHI